MKLDELLEQGRSRGKRTSAPMPGPRGRTRRPPVPPSVGTGAAGLPERVTPKPPLEPPLQGIAGESVQPNDPRFVPYVKPDRAKWTLSAPGVRGSIPLGQWWENVEGFFSPAGRGTGAMGPALGEYAFYAQKQQANPFQPLEKETLEKLPKILPEAWNRYTEASEDYTDARTTGGLTHYEALDVFKKNYPEFPDGYWDAVNIALEIAAIPAGGAVRTGVRLTAKSVPAIIRPFYRAFGETVGAVDTAENAIVAGVIKSTLGSTRYGMDAYDVIRMGQPEMPAPGARRLDVPPEAYQQPGLRERIATWREIKRGLEDPTDPREALEAAGIAPRTGAREPVTPDTEARIDTPPEGIDIPDTRPQQGEMQFKYPPTKTKQDVALSDVEGEGVGPEQTDAGVLTAQQARAGTREQAQALLTTPEGIQAEIDNNNLLISNLRNAKARQEKTGAKRTVIKGIDDEIAQRQEDIARLQTQLDEMTAVEDIPVGDTADLFRSEPEPYYVVPSLRATPEDVIETLMEMGIDEDSARFFLNDPNYDPMTQPGVPEQLRLHQQNKPYAYLAESTYKNKQGKVVTQRRRTESKTLNALDSNEIDAEYSRLLSEELQAQRQPNPVQLRMQAVKNVEQRRAAQPQEIETPTTQQTTPVSRRDPVGEGPDAEDIDVEQMQVESTSSQTEMQLGVDTQGKASTPAMNAGKNLNKSFIQSVKNITFRWRQGVYGTILDRMKPIRRMAVRVKNRKLKTKDSSDTDPYLEDIMATYNNWAAQASRTFRILVKQLNRRTPSITLRELSDYGDLKAVQDKIRMAGDGELKIKVSYGGKAEVSVTTAEEIQKVIDEFIQGLPPQSRMQLEEALTIWADFLDNARMNMVWTGRMNKVQAENLKMNQPYLNPMRSGVDMSKVENFNPIKATTDDEWFDRFQEDIAYTTIRNNNNQMRKTTILTGLEDNAVGDKNALAKQIIRVSSDQDGVEGTMTIYNAGVKQVYKVPENFIDIFGRLNEFGFDNRVAKVLGTTGNWFRIGSTTYNPVFISRSIVGDHYNVISMETGFIRWGKYQGELFGSWINQLLGKGEGGLLEQATDIAYLTGAVQARTRVATEGTGRFARALGRGKQEGGGPISVREQSMTDVFSAENLRREAKNSKIRVFETPQEGIAAIYDDMRKAGLLGIVKGAPRFIKRFTGGIAPRAEFGARITVLIKQLDDEFGRDVWRRMSPEEVARTREGQSAASRMVDITLNFDRGGTAAKQVNTIAPFFNSSFQGFAHPWRRLFAGPTKFLTARYLALSLTLNHWNTMNNLQYPEYRNINQYLRRGTFTFISGYKYDENGNHILDENGNKELNVYSFLPRIWNWGPVMAAQTYLLEKIYEDDPSGGTLAATTEAEGLDVPLWLQIKGAGETAGEVSGEYLARSSPITIEGDTTGEVLMNLNPFPGLQAALEVVYNKNFFTGRTVYPEVEDESLNISRAYDIPDFMLGDDGELGGQKGAFIVQHMVQGLFGRSTNIAANIIDKIFDLVDDPYTEENIRDFEEYSKLDELGKAQMRRNKSSAWVATMRRMARDPDLDGFDLPIAEEIKDVFKPERNWSELFYETADNIKNLTPFDYDHSTSVAKQLAPIYDEVRDGKIRLQKILAANNYTPAAWQNWHDDSKELNQKIPKALAKIKDTEKYPDAIQFSENADATINYYNILATAANRTEDKRTIGEQIYRSIHAITAELDEIGISGMEQAPNVGKLIEEQNKKLEELSPEAREAYEEWRQSRQITDAEEMWDEQIKIISDSGYWDAGTPKWKERFLYANTDNINERANLEQKVDIWLDSDRGKRESLEGQEGTPSERKVYTSIKQAFIRSKERREAKALILRNNDSVRKALEKLGYKKPEEKEPATGKASSGPRMIIPRIGGIG